MKYVSTRGEAPVLGFEDVLLTGLARDGGLYLPESWPTLTAGEIASFGGQSYEAVAEAVMRPFIGGEISDDELNSIVAEAYGSFSHRLVAPLVQIGPREWILELFHGPTLAFKDVAMQVLARLMDRALSKRRKRVTIVGATSGDTGGAAIEAFRGREAIDVVIFYPHGRVSGVQRRQMTTPSEPNVHALAIDGTFDDCQNLVKALFNNQVLRDEFQLAGVNSINWARLMAQIVYYFTSAVALGAPERKIAFAVPTGNFGDVFAGYAALRMGLPIQRLVIATNVNDILVRTFETGRYSLSGVTATYSPSMDIQISSNFERLLFELAGRDASRVRGQMRALGQSGEFELSAVELSGLRRDFSASRVDEAGTLAEIRRLKDATGYLADPHTAVGAAGARAVAAAGEFDPGTPIVILSTAHPAKFPDAVAKAVGTPPVAPQSVVRQSTLPERENFCSNDIVAVTKFIREHTRAGSGR